MKTIFAALLTLALAVSVVAADDKKPDTASKQSQTEKMKACNKEAAEKALKGDARKQFMSACLKGSTKM